MAAAEQVRTEQIERIPLPRTQQAHTTQQGSHDLAAVRCGGSHSSLTAPRGSDPLRRLQRALRTLPFPPFEHAATRAFVEPADGIFFLMLKIPWHSYQRSSTRCGDGTSTCDGGQCSLCSALSYAAVLELSRCVGASPCTLANEPLAPQRALQGRGGRSVMERACSCLDCTAVLQIRYCSRLRLKNHLSFSRQVDLYASSTRKLRSHDGVAPQAKGCERPGAGVAWRVHSLIIQRGPSLSCS